MRLVEVNIDICPMDSPTDISKLEQLLDTGKIRADEVVAVIGKTEGTGLGYDLGREIAHKSILEALSRRMTGIVNVNDRVAIMLSGGTPGVLSPHITVVSRVWRDPGVAEQSQSALTVGVSRSEPILPEEIGRIGQIRKVASAVVRAQLDAGLDDANDVHLVLVKGPSLTREGIQDAHARGARTVTTDLSIGPEGAMCYANDGAALGVAVALGEISVDRVHDDAIRRDWSLYSSVAMTSSGGEKTYADVILFGNNPQSLSRFRIGHAIMHDFIDTVGVKEALRSAGLRFDCCPEDLTQIVQIFAKYVIPDTETLRGYRIGLQDDLQAFATAKAVGGGVIGCISGRPTVWISGGERNSHQGPPGSNPVAAIVRVP